MGSCRRDWRSGFVPVFRGGKLLGRTDVDHLAMTRKKGAAGVFVVLAAFGCLRAGSRAGRRSEVRTRSAAESRDCPLTRPVFAHDWLGLLHLGGEDVDALRVRAR